MRLGLDVGTNSIGWWLYKIDGAGPDAQITGVIDGGVRIFTDGRDPKSGASLAVDRRVARSMRRRRDRYLRRRAALMKVLANTGLMPNDPDERRELTTLDPYKLRAMGLDEPLPLTHLGRALFHLNQRRGFKSNRKTDRGDNESGMIKDATRRLDLEMMATGARTYGEFLHRRREADGEAVQHRVPSVRTRLTRAVWGGPDAKEEDGYDFYPDRRHLEEEFDALWKAQAGFHGEVLTDKLRDVVFEKIFFQRPLKEPKVGLCPLTGEQRLHRSDPLAQRRVLYETVNHLRITADGRRTRPLTLDERDRVIFALDQKKPTKTPATMKFKLDALATKVLKLPEGERFTLQTAVRDAIACDPVRASLTHPDRFGGHWSELDAEAQSAVVARIREVESETDYEELVAWLQQTYGLDEKHAEKTATAPLPDGYGRLGQTATESVLEKLKAEVITYADAVAACGWHHSNRRTGEGLDQLPYYGEPLDRHVIPGTGDPGDDEIARFGRITNPTVHIGMNQLRRVVNRIIERYGKPDQIVVELARELKQSKKEKDQYNKGIQDNTKAAQKRSSQLGEHRITDNGHNRMLLRLWEDLGPHIGPRHCPYTGKVISMQMVFDGSCDVDHILPYSRTLDDSFSNRTLCTKESNREKGNQTPWEAWGETARWGNIEANLKNLNKNKSWRFNPDAMERFEDKNDFLDRALVDTQYLARISCTYLETLYADGGHVWVIPGRMTEMLRRHWGLNSLLSDRDRGAAKAKNRTDHRHHAIDAAVIAATDRSLLNKISRAAGLGKERAGSAEDIARNTEPPWKHFRDDVQDCLERMVISHRADHGRIDLEARKTGHDTTSGQLHNETAYGIVDENCVVSRKPLMTLKPDDIKVTSKGKNIRDGELQKALALAVGELEGKEFEAALRDFTAKPGPYQGIRRVRMLENMPEGSRVEIGERPNGSPLKAYKGDSNHCYELWRLPGGKVEPQVVTTFDAHAGVEKRPHPAAKRLLRLFKRDMVVLDRKGETQICYVQQLSLAVGIVLAPHREANGDARDRDKEDSFNFIRIGATSIIKAGLRRVLVDEIGRVRDPGPPAL